MPANRPWIKEEVPMGEQVFFVKEKLFGYIIGFNDDKPFDYSLEALYEQCVLSGGQPCGHSKGEIKFEQI